MAGVPPETASMNAAHTCVHPCMRASMRSILACVRACAWRRAGWRGSSYAGRAHACKDWWPRAGRDGWPGAGRDTRGKVWWMVSSNDDGLTEESANDRSDPQSTI